MSPLQSHISSISFIVQSLLSSHDCMVVSSHNSCTVISISSVAVHPLSSVTVTMYVPASSIVTLGLVGFFIEEVKLLGPSQFHIVASFPISSSCKLSPSQSSVSIASAMASGSPPRSIISTDSIIMASETLCAANWILMATVAPVRIGVIMECPVPVSLLQISLGVLGSNNIQGPLSIEYSNPNQSNPGPFPHSKSAAPENTEGLSKE